MTGISYKCRFYREQPVGGRLQTFYNVSPPSDKQNERAYDIVYVKKSGTAEAISIEKCFRLFSDFQKIAKETIFLSLKKVHLYYMIMRRLQQ